MNNLSPSLGTNMSLIATEQQVKNNQEFQNRVRGPLLFLRHGETHWNTASRYQGHQNTSLSEKGRRQADNCANHIRDWMEVHAKPTDNWRLFSSPLERALETASIISDRLSDRSPGVEIANPLMELSMGRWEGLNSQQVKDRYYQERKSRKSNRWDFKPEGGQSLSDRQPEIEHWLANVPGNSLIVTHSGILRIVHHLLTSADHSVSALMKIEHAELWVWVCDKLHMSGNNSEQC